MTTPTGQITVTDINTEANRKPYPSAYANPPPDPSFPLSVKWPVATFGDDPTGAQWANVLERNSALQTSFDTLRGKQNAFTLYDSNQFYYVGGCGSGEKDTITPGLRLEYFYPYLTDDMWFSIDVASPSTTGSRAVPGGTLNWNVCSAGNYNGAFEVWRHFFRVKPINTSRTYTDLGYSRMQDVGAGSEQMAAFNNYSVTKDSRGNIVTYYYNIRYGFGRDSGNLYGNRTFIYYRPTDKVVYATSQYDGFKNNSPIYQAHIYLLRIQFWPPNTITIGNLTGGAKEYNATAPNATNNEHTQFINGMNAYLGQFPPIVSTVLPIDGGKVVVPATPPNIATNGGSNITTPGGGGCKIICTKLHELGLMSQEIFEADQKFGEELKVSNPDVYNGYISWAQIVVDWMEGNGPCHPILFWIRDKEKRREFTKKIAIDWAYKIASPWAEWMAGKKNKTGYALWAIGAPISKVVGVWKKWFGKNTNTTCEECLDYRYHIKGFVLLTILAFLRIVAMFDGKKK